MDQQDLEENELIREVLVSAGFSDSFLPIVNEDNKKLLETIKFLSKSKLDHESALEGEKRELTRVGDILKTIDNEFDQNLKLLNAHKSQYTAEYHLLKLGEHEDLRFKQMLKEVEKEGKEMHLKEESFKCKLNHTKWH